MNLINNRSLVRLVIALIACLMVIGVQTTFAQTTGSGTLRGTVKDPQGAIVRGATVTLTNERTKDERKTVTRDDGDFTFSALAPGEYKLTIEASGFKKVEQSNLAIETSSTRSLDIVTEIGAPSETVVISSGPGNLQTETGAKENTITAAQIDNLSIISRSSLELLRILPGVVAPDNTSLESISFGGGANANANYHVNGLRGEQNNVTIDGSRMIDIGSNNGTVITANPDMVQEVKVQTSNYAAEHGTSAVQISATTKGGSSHFHGSIDDYIRHNQFQSNDRSNSIGGPDGRNIVARPLSKYNYPGGNVGGPVVLPWTNFNKNRDKLFFFVGYERYYQQVDEGSRFFTVPTLKMRSGDFSELAPGSVTVPAGCTANGVVGNPGNNNDVAPNNDLRPCKDPTALS